MTPLILDIRPVLLHVISSLFLPVVQWSAITVTYNEIEIHSVYKSSLSDSLNFVKTNISNSILHKKHFHIKNTIHCFFS